MGSGGRIGLVVALCLLVTACGSGQADVDVQLGGPAAHSSDRALALVRALAQEAPPDDYWTPVRLAALDQAKSRWSLPIPPPPATVTTAPTPTPSASPQPGPSPSPTPSSSPSPAPSPDPTTQPQPEPQPEPEPELGPEPEPSPHVWATWWCEWGAGEGGLRSLVCLGDFGNDEELERWGCEESMTQAGRTVACVGELGAHGPASWACDITDTVACATPDLPRFSCERWEDWAACGVGELGQDDDPELSRCDARRDGDRRLLWCAGLVTPGMPMTALALPQLWVAHPEA